MTGNCYGCQRTGVEVATSYEHGGKLLCADCTAKPHQPPRAYADDEGPPVLATPRRRGVPHSRAPVPSGQGDAPSPTPLRKPNRDSMRPVPWAWAGRIPIGRVSLIVGNEGVGKGMVVAWLASKLSHGTLPGDLEGTPANVLVVGDEDALDDTWTPRLHAAGADFARVFFPPEDVAELDLTTAAGCAQLRAWVKEYAIRVAVFDALLDHLGVTDEYKPKAVRGALRPVRRLAREEEFAALGSMHPRKGQGLVFRDLVAASHQFNAVSRSSLLLAEHPDDEAGRVLLRGKGNLAAPAPALEFRIRSHVFQHAGFSYDQPQAVEWRESELKLGDVLKGGSSGRPPDEDKRAQVRAALGDEPQSAKALVRATGVAESTLRDILREFDEDGEAVKLAAGWVRAGGCGILVRGDSAPPAPDLMTTLKASLAAQRNGHQGE